MSSPDGSVVRERWAWTALADTSGAMRRRPDLLAVLREAAYDAGLE
jgi:hypothetical protein